MLKCRYPHIQVIIGGPHATYYTQECIAQGFDAVCMGDGERIFEAILQGDDETLNSLKHSYSSEATSVFCDWLTESEMNSYPLPLREKAYIGRHKYMLRDRLATTLVNARGCPMKCAFCEHGLDHRSKWYAVDHFRAEVESILSLGINGIMIFDDLFALNPKKCKPYLDVLRGYYHSQNLIFRCFGHAKTIAKFPEMTQMLANAGCVEMGFGAESASQLVLDNIDKGTKVSELHNFVNRVIEAGMNVKAFFMIGLPGESREEFLKTQGFIRQYREKYPNNFDFDLAVLYPYRGTKIGNILRSDNYRSIQLRVKPGFSWGEENEADWGAYKKKGGDSDIIVEPYDWSSMKALLTVQEIEDLKEETMLLSKRYTNVAGERIRNPRAEGSIETKPFVTEHGFAEGIEGWLKKEEGELLHGLAKECTGEGTIVEIGSWKGKSTVCLATGSQRGNRVKVYAIDPHTGSAQTEELVGEQWTYPDFMNNINKAGVEDIVVPLVMTSEEAARDFDEPVELIFVDGDHDYEMVQLDFQLWFPKLIIGGTMAFHDTEGWPGPEKVAEECLRDSVHFANYTVVDSLAFATKVSD